MPGPDDSLRWRRRLEEALSASGASSFGYRWDNDSVLVFFLLEGRQCVINMALPDRDADEFCFTQARRTRRSESVREQLYEHAVRDRWRILAQLIEAKFEAIQAGILTMETEFGQYALRAPLALLPGG